MIKVLTVLVDRIKSSVNLCTLLPWQLGIQKGCVYVCWLSLLSGARQSGICSLCLQNTPGLSRAVGQILELPWHSQEEV